MDGTDSAAYRMTGIGISGAEFSVSFFIWLFNKAISIETMVLMIGLSTNMEQLVE
jgi:hypothetical protein